MPWFICEIKVIALVAILHRFTSRCFCKICTFTKMCHSCRQPLQYTMASKPVTPCRTLSGHLCPVVSVSSSEHGQNFPKKKRTKTYAKKETSIKKKMHPLEACNTSSDKCHVVNVELTGWV